MQRILKQHYLVLFLAVLVAFGAAAGLMRFAKVIDERVARVLAVKSELSSYEANKKIYIDEAKELARIEERASALDAHRITDEQIPPLLSKIEALAQARNVALTINAVDTREKKEGEEKTLSVSFSGDGLAQNMDLFLRDLSSQSYEVRFDKFSLYRNETEAGALPTWNLLATVDIVSY